MDSLGRWSALCYFAAAGSGRRLKQRDPGVAVEMALRTVDLFAPDESERAELATARRPRANVSQDSGEQGGAPGVLRVWLRDDWVSLDSPYAPEREAVRAAAASEEGQRVLVLGAASGYLARELVHKRCAQIVVVGFCRAAIAQHRRILADTDCDVTLVVGRDIDRIWSAVSVFLTQPTSVVLHPRVSRYYWPEVARLLLRVEQRAAPPPARRRDDIEHVMFFGAGGLMEKELLRGFFKLGIKTTVVPPLTERQIGADDAWRLLRQHDPDLVLSTNNQGADRRALFPEACELAGVPWATWYLDDPRFLAQADQLSGLARRSIAFCWDRNGDEAWRELGFANAAGLPLCTDPEQFTPGPGEATLEGRLVFVGGARFARARGYFLVLDDDPKAHAVVERLGPEVLAGRRAPGQERLAQVLEELGLQGHFDAQSRQRLPAFVVQEQSRIYRLNALRAVAALRPIVFGDGWQGTLPESVEIRPSVDYDRQLPAIYQSDAVHLSLTNLQMRSFPNQRPFDVGACGRMVLQDRLDGWHELFDGRLDPLIFDDREQLVARAADLLEDRNARHELGQLLRQQVLAKHTYEHRLRRILEVIRSARAGP